MSKLFISDLDGTLFDDNKKISVDNLNMIIKLRKMGHYFSIATSRYYKALYFLLKDMDLCSPVICSNGSFIYDFKNNKTIYKNNIDTTIASNIVKLALDNNYPTFAQAENYLYVSKDNGRFVNYKNPIMSINPIELSLDNLANLNDVFQISVGTNDPIKTKEWFKAKLINIDIDVVITGKDVVVFKPLNTSKASGAKFLLDYYNLKEDDLIVFGDDENDISLFKYSKYSYAMSNARDEIKKMANKVASSNNDSGVAKAINDFLKTNNY